MMKNITTFCQTLLVVTTGLCLLSQTSSSYTLALAQPLHPVTATTTYNQTDVWEATYYFTLALPASTKQPLQKIAFTQIQGLESITFDGKNSRAFEGTPNRKGQKLGLTLTKSNEQQQTVIVTLDRPILPGTTITIALKSLRNPSYDGVYLFQVKALASESQTQGQVVGTARLQFYNESSSSN